MRVEKQAGMVAEDRRLEEVEKTVVEDIRPADMGKVDTLLDWEERRAL